ncbi:diacylglycerol/lipid kinase family protein [Alkalicoccus halolimnae]|uniref:Diacylglycerol kinase family protein n=1 Tax=Alkalicoccus halolimnae TaxID=1667239 RepID=A0A5C7FKG0_9BACI|nr:diacylglycerol kinase family protein [Alkalicoccus halolimnae]TXF85295.1 diacylglycerol kinase family lipid kinase [Alkalicoccus halolimnae]
MYGFIVNKTAGSGKGHNIWKKTEKELKRKKVPYIVAFTKEPNDAGRLTDDLLNSSVKIVVAVGGDGTVNEAAAALVHKGIPLGIIPAGSGNDFARSLGITGNTQQALFRIFKNNPKKIDVLQTGDRCGLTVTGIGFDGKVAETANESPYKKWFNMFGLGRLSYTVSVLQVLKSFKPVNVTLTIDGRQRVFTDVWLTAVANAPNYGGNILICPEAVNNDGCLDICVLHGRNKWPLIRQIPKIYRGKHTSNENISFFRGTNVDVHSVIPFLVQSDGELIGETPVRVQIIKEALTVL